MKIFDAFEDNINYKRSLQIDGAFAICHTSYGPLFNNAKLKVGTTKFKKKSILSKKKREDILNHLFDFIGTCEQYNKKEEIQLWEAYWLEYINAFNESMKALPNSIVTIYIGRQAIELGIKYLLLKEGSAIHNTHDLGYLANLLYKKYKINDNYMEYLNTFCELYCAYIEGGNSEYFRFPKYKHNKFFAGNNLDMRWLSYNFTLILLKLIHFANLEEKFLSQKVKKA